MSQFTAFESALNGAVFDFYGDPTTIKPGPLNTGKENARTRAVRDVERVQDLNGAVSAEINTIEFIRADWPHPRRGDQITLNNQTWQVTTLRDATGQTHIVEVTYA